MDLGPEKKIKKKTKKKQTPGCWSLWEVKHIIRIVIFLEVKLIMACQTNLSQVWIILNYLLTQGNLTYSRSDLLSSFQAVFNLGSNSKESSFSYSLRSNRDLFYFILFYFSHFFLFWEQNPFIRCCAYNSYRLTSNC